MLLKNPRLVFAALGLVVAALLATSVPGIFTIDEDSYIATIVGLRNGDLRLDETAGLTPSRELLSFDAAPHHRSVPSTPVTTNLPPLYAVIALPFSWLGLRGLMALQTLCFALSAFLVFSYVRRETERLGLAWFACGVFVLASYSIEYAQGIWPHMLSVALTTFAVDMTSRIRASERERLPLAALAGLAVGVATGVRYQNAALIALVALTFLWTKRPVRHIAAFAIACALPLIASAAMNHERLGSWNPVSKGPTYLSTHDERTTVDKVEDGVVVTWARVVDFTAWPASPPDDVGTAAILRKDSQTGAFLINGALKKALVQSAPWVLLPFAAMLVAWRRRKEKTAPGRDVRELRMLSIVVAGLILSFAPFGFRHDGWCFNQRYFLELMPLLSIGLALVLNKLDVRWRSIAVGAVAGIGIGVVICMQAPMSNTHQFLEMRLPLGFAVVLLVAWALVRLSARLRPAFLWATLGVCLGWAVAIHFGDDLPTSRFLRETHRDQLAVVRNVLPADRPIALIAYWGNKDAYGPLLLDRSIVIVDPSIDNGADARTLLLEMQRQGRATFVITSMPRELLVALAQGQKAFGIRTIPWLAELRAAAP